MKTRSDVVIAHDGSNKEMPVEVVVCPDCEGTFFAIYYLDGDPTQMHLQCGTCQTTFCGHSGNCSKGFMN